MNIPAHAERFVQEQIPEALDSDQLAGRHCVYCSVDFAATRRKPVPLGRRQDRDVNGCRYCLTDLIARARVERNETAQQARIRKEARLRYNRSLSKRFLQACGEIRQAVRCVEELVQQDSFDALELSYLVLELESAYEWAKSWKPEMRLDDDPSPMADLNLEISILNLYKIAFRNLAYQAINEDTPPEPDLCGDLECPEDCDGRHEWTDIDFGYDTVFERLREYGYEIEGGREENLPDLDFVAHLRSRTIPGQAL